MDKELQSSGNLPEDRYPEGFRIMKGSQEFVSYFEKSSLRIFPSNVPTSYNTHTHNAVEVVKVEKGCSIYHLPDRIYEVKAGETLFVPPNTPHALMEPDGVQRYVLLFEPAPFNSLLDLPPMGKPIYIDQRSEIAPIVQEYLHKVIRAYFDFEPMWNTRCYGLLFEMTAFIAPHNNVSEVEVARQVSHGKDTAVFGAAFAYINEHYREDIKLETVAAFTGFSKYYFCRMFKQYAEVNFSDYLTRKRLNAATDLLLRSNLSIRQVAQEAGFGSMATFNRLFREYRNCTPSQFRSMYASRYMADTTVPPL